MNGQARLKFFFGTMGSGKSTQALQIRHNLATRGLQVLLTTQLDRESGRVSSRLGVSAEAQLVTSETDLFELARDHRDQDGLDALVCDEAQFYSPTQIEQLAFVVDLLGVDVFAFGLLTSFQGELFPGTQRLLELADERSELQVEARCFCGSRATHNARIVDGRQVYAGELKVVGDTTDRSEASVAYELRCRYHWHEAKWESEGRQLMLPVGQTRPSLTNTPIEPTLPLSEEIAADDAE
ncbi:MAG: thymidine kinase [Actinomycetota bacterium]